MALIVWHVPQGGFDRSGTVHNHHKDPELLPDWAVLYPTVISCHIRNTAERDTDASQRVSLIPGANQTDVQSPCQDNLGYLAHKKQPPPPRTTIGP